MNRLTQINYLREMERLTKIEDAAKAWRVAYLKFVSEGYDSENDAALREAEEVLSISIDGSGLP